MGYYDDYLEHHGILGMKWGIRRFQNKDGSLTAAGRKRYDVIKKDGQDSNPNIKHPGTITDGYQKMKKPEGARSNNIVSTQEMPKIPGTKTDGYQKTKMPTGAKVDGPTGEEKKGLSTGQKVAIGAGITAAAVLATYGGYKLSQINKTAVAGISEKYRKIAENHRVQYDDALKTTNIYNEIGKKVSDINKRKVDILTGWGNDVADFHYKRWQENELLSKSKKYPISEKIDYLKSLKK